jgi:hypothetical protein
MKVVEKIVSACLKVVNCKPVSDCDTVLSVVIAVKTWASPYRNWS